MKNQFGRLCKYLDIQEEKKSLFTFCNHPHNISNQKNNCNICLCPLVKNFMKPWMKKCNPDLIVRFWRKKGRPDKLKIRISGVQLTFVDTIAGELIYKNFNTKGSL